MKHVKKNSGNSGLHMQHNRRMANQQAPIPALSRKTDMTGISENHPAEDPRLRSYHRNENQARFTAAQHYSYPGSRSDYKIQRQPWGPDAAYESNDMDQIENDEPMEDEARTLDRIRAERSRMLDDE